jgi:hypothetical protein
MLLPLAAVLLLALLWTVYWFVAKNMAETRFTEERRKLAAQGLTLVCTEEGWGGYPFHFEFACSSPTLRLEQQAEVRSGDLLLTALAYAPWQIVVLVDGPTTVSARNELPTAVNHDRALAAVTFDSNWRPRVSAEVTALTVEGWGSANKIMFHAKPSDASGFDIAISTEKANYQPSGRPPLLIDQGDLLGSVPDGRTLNVGEIILQQGTVRYWGSGTVSLDDARMPSGRLATQTNDLDGLFAILDPHLEIKDDEKAGLRAMLGLLGNEAKAPLIAKDGILYLGPFKIAEFVPLY